MNLKATRPNCSTYNPCGKNGYCRDNKQKEWTCLCKFWWDEPVCDKMSNSGIQVIVLGVLVGVLLVIFYGLMIIRSIIKKRKLRQIHQAQTSTINRTFPSVHINNFHPSHRRLAWLTAILTIFITILTLIIKWRLIQPIHDEIITKLNLNETVYYTPHSICQTIDLVKQFNILTFPIACFLIFIFSLITKRMSKRRHRCMRDRIGIPIPLDFFAHVKRTLAAVIFAIFADELLDIVKETFSLRKPSQGIIIAYLIQILKGFAIGIRRYPILAAVYINTCFSLICASLYIWLDFSLTIVYTSFCRTNYYPTEKEMNTSTSIYFLLDYYGTGSKLVIFQLLFDTPRYICLAYLSVKLPILLIKQIQQRKSNKKRLTREQQNLLYSSLPHSTESIYVKQLLNIHQTNLPNNRLANIFRYIYEWRDDFRFSSRITSVYAAIFLTLYFLIFEVSVTFPPYLFIAQAFCQAVIDEILHLFNPPNPNLLQLIDPPSDFPLPNLNRSFHIAIYLSLLITILQLIIMLVNIRRNLLQTYRGDDTEIPRRTPALHVNYVTGNFHFAGYLIGYVVLGFTLVSIVVFIFGICIDAFITHGSVRALELLLKFLIPIILFPLFKLYLNKFLGQYIFLQYGGEVLHIDNRRALMVFLYLNFFLDAFLGLITAFIRLLKSTFGAVIYMCRLDYSPLGRKLETVDAGFNAYCGFIHIESAHRHPVLLCFVSHLIRNQLESKTKKKFSRAKQKWSLAIFLIHNPELVYLRKGFLKRRQNKSDDIWQQERF